MGDWIQVRGPRSAVGQSGLNARSARESTAFRISRSIDGQRDVGCPAADRGPIAADRHGSGGFTLIEVLAALVIVSLGMLAVIQAVSQTASNSTYLRDRTIAHWVAMNRLSEVRLDQNPPTVDETSDEVEMAGREWRWTMTVTQTPVETMRRIDVSVRPSEADEDSSMATVTGFYGTAIAPPGAAVILWEGLGDAGGRNPRDRDRDDDSGDDTPPGSDPEPDPSNTPDPTNDEPASE